MNAIQHINIHRQKHQKPSWDIFPIIHLYPRIRRSLNDNGTNPSQQKSQSGPSSGPKLWMKQGILVLPSRNNTCVYKLSFSALALNMSIKTIKIEYYVQDIYSNKANYQRWNSTHHMQTDYIGMYSVWCLQSLRFSWHPCCIQFCLKVCSQKWHKYIL